MPRRRTTPYALLAMLSLGPKSGYDISRQLAFSVGHFWAESNGQIYPALNSLVTAGLAMRRQERRHSRGRVVYTITDKGRQALTAWLAQPAAAPAMRNELLLKLFVGWHVDPDVSIAQVERVRAAVTEQRNAFAAIRAAIDEEAKDESDAAFWRITLRAGEAVTNARLTWCTETLDVLNRLKARRPHGTLAARSKRMNALMQRLERRFL